MSRYSEEKIVQAFKIYTVLASKGQVEGKEGRIYMTDDDVRNLVQLFIGQVDCTLFVSGSDTLILLPLALTSPFHVTNETIKKDYFSAKAVNLDIYMMYVAIIILFGEFYDSYQNRDATRAFIPVNDWLTEINERMAYIGAMEPERLEAADREFEYNWTEIHEKWEALNDVRDGVKADGRTVSRLAFLNTVIRFLEDRGLITRTGIDEIALTHRAHIIIVQYFMDQAYNRNILEFLYQDKLSDVSFDPVLAKEV